MNAASERQRTAEVRVGFPFVSDKHGRPLYDGRGKPITVPVSDLTSETDAAIKLIEKARMELRFASMRACWDPSVSESVHVALLAAEEAMQAATARRTALEGLQ